jgi:hypothetical protein
MALIQRHAPAEYSHWRPEEVKIIGDRAVRFRDVCVHEFLLGDVDDPDIYAAAPIWEWQQSESGCWVMEHAATQPYYLQHMDINAYGYRVRIMARLSEQDEVFWRLKWGKNK